MPMGGFELQSAYGLGRATDYLLPPPFKRSK